MSELITRTAKLLPRSKRLKPFPGFATAYHYEPEDQKHELGSLYVVIEVLTGPKQAEAVADLVIETIGNQFFNADADKKQSPLERFENAIKTTNHALAEHTNNGNASWVGRMSAVIAVLAGEELHISQTGSAEAYLYRGNVTSHITADLQSKSQQRPINTFANIATGTLQAHDRLVIATPAFFHQIQRAQVKSILNDNTANGSIQKLSELISHNDEANRVALIIIELTTPELLAMQVQDDQPEAIQVGQPDKPLEVAKAIAVPAAATILNTSKTMSAKAAHQAKTRLIPGLGTIGHKLAAAIRNRISTRKGQLQLAAVLAVLVLIITSVTLLNHKKQSQAEKIATFQSIYQEYLHAQDYAAQGDKANANKLLAQAKKQLSNLRSSVNENVFTKQLLKQPHPENQPTSSAGLQNIIAALSDKVNNIIKLKTTQLANFSQIKNAKPTFIELVSTKLIMADNQAKPSFYVYDLTSKSFSAGAKTPTGFGRVVATAPSSDNSGLYVLTDIPSVWLYKALDNSLAQQSLNFGDWPKGKALASFNGNLYELASDGSQLYKFTPTSAGFTVPTNYFPAGVTNGSTAIAIDGSIYLVGGKGGLRRFTSGKLDKSLTSLPQNFQDASTIRSVNDGDRLILIDSKFQKIALLDSTLSAISFNTQISLEGATSIYAATTDLKSTILYAIINGKLVSSPMP